MLSATVHLTDSSSPIHTIMRLTGRHGAHECTRCLERRPGLLCGTEKGRPRHALLERIAGLHDSTLKSQLCLHWLPLCRILIVESINESIGTANTGTAPAVLHTACYTLHRVCEDAEIYGARENASEAEILNANSSMKYQPDMSSIECRRCRAAEKLVHHNLFAVYYS